MRTFNVLVAVFALVQLARYARAALLFLVPTVRVRGEPGVTPPTAARLRGRDELEALGFVPLGVLRERGPLGARAAEADAYASAAHGAYADVQDGRRGPEVAFFTPFPGEAAVLTSNVPRRAIVSGSTQAGGVPGATIEAVLAAHQVAVRRFAARHGPPVVDETLEGRVGAARRWYQGEGRRELRRGAAVPFAIAALGALLLASAVNILLRGAT